MRKEEGEVKNMTVSAWKPKKMSKKLTLQFSLDLTKAKRAPMEELNKDARELETRLLAARQKRLDGSQ